MLLRHLARFGPVALARGAGHGPYNRALLAAGQHHRLIACRYFSQELVAGWPEGIRRFLEQEKIEKPTLIQEKTLPIAMENKNLVGIARTGSGKTLAFVIPAVMKVLKAKEEANNATSPISNQSQDDDMDRDFMPRSYMNRPQSKPTCLVLAPTRELASQTSAVFDRFHRLGLKTISLVGGASRQAQLQQIQRQSYDVYVATPGRLIDLVETNCVDLSGIKYLVLDEADRMLDMGFEPQIRRILESMPEDKQTLMWSATWPQEIQALAQEFLQDYEYVAVDSEKLKANPNIKQIIKICEPHDKLRQLLDNLKQFKEDCPEPRVLIFVNTKRMADSMLVHLMRNRIKAISIHGDRSQNQRDHALRMFRERMCHVLVATDVAARGLDISDITHVVNFDFPNSIEDYIHRIGRTARHERMGTALSLFTLNEGNMARKLVQVLRETNQEIPDGLEDMQIYGSGKSTRSFGRGGGNRDARGYGGGGYQSNNMSRGGGDFRNDFGYKRSNSRYGFDERQSSDPRRGGNNRRYDDGDDEDFDDESPYDRNDRYDRFGRGNNRKARGGGIFDD